MNSIRHRIPGAAVSRRSAVARGTPWASAAATHRWFGRSLLLIILAVGGFFVASVVLADVLVHGRDLGRRRTLGAARVLAILAAVAAAVLPAIFAAVRDPVRVLRTP